MYYKLKGLNYSFCEGQHSKVYYASETNNMIVFDMEGVFLFDVSEATSNKAFKHLTKVLKENKDILVVWSTKGYTIYHGINSSLYKDITVQEVIDKVQTLYDNPIPEAKYTSVKDRIMTEVKG